MLKEHPKLFAVLFILITVVLYVVGVIFAIKSNFIIGIVLWVIGMIFLINAIYCIQDYKKNQIDNRYD